MVVAAEAGVVENGLFHLVKSRARSQRPHIADWFSVVLKHDVPERGDADFEIRDITRIKLNEADELGDVAHDLRGVPVLKQLVFRHSGPITFRANVDANKFETGWEDM